ncbi:hypothetical protein LPB90_06730 [Chryseobacterium sp. LC2016-29]|uniref:hypothetical protein n=1 Tax=Chryseobacterium sp. LC2016-29 TaxID=2897331 RepID=UPI001E52E9DE|nr:hypothetical protein [Chryseobacterium sp. LC2016-29]MCD0478145.1 hypothetical protein [Chryseobacterium sp. LC2016-29]
MAATNMKTKILFISFIFLSLNLFHSQIKSPDLYLGENLYIEMPNYFKTKSSNDKVTIESHIITIGMHYNGGKKITFKVLPNGTLIRSIIVLGRQLPNIRITYVNKDNQPIKVEKNKLQNFITYKELTEQCTIENLMLILSQFKNVYIVNDDSLAKKVQIEQLYSL